MTVVTVSPKYQVVIPKDIRDKLRIRPGQKVEAFAIGARIELVSVEPIEDPLGRYPKSCLPSNAKPIDCATSSTPAVGSSTSQEVRMPRLPSRPFKTNPNSWSRRSVCSKSTDMCFGT